MSTLAVDTVNTPLFRPPSDFADWLSPILVKELRQGLKTRMFVSVFVALQVTLILLMGFQLLSHAAGGRNDDGYNLFFWATIWIPLLILMPARGLVAVSSEIKANTLDLVQLTRLTAFRIVLGKWVALVSQTLLLVVAVMPYAVLRYFFGGVDIVSDLLIIGNLLLGSLVLTAFTVMLSSMHIAVRILILVVIIPLSISVFGAVGAAFAFSRMGSGSVSMSTSFITPGVFIWVVSILGNVGMIYYLLEMAAGRIAPLGENHSGPRRAVALGSALLVSVLMLVTGDIENLVLLNAFIPLWGWSVLEALFEKTVPLPIMYRSFARRGFPGRLLGRIFYPGWASGICFALLMYGALAGSAFVVAEMNSRQNGMDWMVYHMLGFAALILPVLILRLFPKLKQPGWLYVLIQALFVLIFIIAMIMAEVPGVRTGSYEWLAFFPLSALLAQGIHGDDSLLNHYSLWAVPVCVLIVITALILVMKEFRWIRRLEDQALEEASAKRA